MSPFVWLIAGGVFLVIELMTLGLTTIWFMGGAIVAFFLNVMGVSLLGQMIAFIVVTGLLILAVRPFAVRKVNNHTQKTNVESLVGQKAVVTESVDNVAGKGAAKLDGKEWTARSITDDFHPHQGEIVKVVRIEGVKLIIEKV